tara:strand:+ start:964 stop:1602 length:639 start_codon:yes stop_codon:yes gene_type:complete
VREGIEVIIEPGALAGTISVDYPNLTFQPEANFNGLTSVFLRLTDGFVTSAPFEVSFEVAPLDDPPSFGLLPNQTVSAFENLSQSVAAVDIDTPDLTHSAVGLPGWVNLDPATGLLSGTPTNSDIGEWTNIVVTASDGTTMVDSQPFSITTTFDPYVQISVEAPDGYRGPDIKDLNLVGCEALVLMAASNNLSTLEGILLSYDICTLEQNWH